MKYRALGNTGLEVSEIGFGTWGIGGVVEGAHSYGPTNDKESRQALRRAFDLGITLYDTSPLYGLGHSEELLGQAFAKDRSKVIMASKVGFHSFTEPQDFSLHRIRSSLEETLGRLRTDYLDLYQLHSPPPEVLADGRVLAALADLKQEGKIRAYGISIKSPHDGIRAVQRFPSLQMNFSMTDQRARTCGLFDCAIKNNIGIIARTPFNFGILTGKFSETKFDPRDHRSARSPEQLRQWSLAADELTKLNKGKNRTLAQLALQFCLAHQAVSAVIPGMLTVAEVEENVQVSKMGQLEESNLKTIYHLYQ